MKMRIAKLLPGHGQNVPIGEIVDAHPSTFIKGCFNIHSIDRKVPFSILTVPSDHLEEIEEERLKREKGKV